MKKIDLHIHTKSSSQDREFSFSKEVLQRYVSEAELSCIAITNHNLFDKNQFSEIKSALEILVLPGIEVDVENDGKDNLDVGVIVTLYNLDEDEEFESKLEAKNIIRAFI